MEARKQQLFNYIDLAAKTKSYISIQTYTLGNYGDWVLKTLTFELLQRFGRTELCEIIYMAIKELVNIAIKANLKKILTDNYSDYKNNEHNSVWLQQHWEQLNLGKLDTYLSETKSYNLPVSICFSTTKSDKFEVLVKHNRALSAVEDEQLRNQFKTFNGHVNLKSFVTTHDNIEDTAFTLAFLRSLLKGSGLDSSLLRIYSNNDETIARLEIPSRPDFVSTRLRFEQELKISNLQRTEFRQKFSNNPQNNTGSRQEIESLVAENNRLNDEVASLKKEKDAWEAVFDIGHNELISAEQTIKAQEMALDLSQDELKALHTDIEKMINIETLFETELMRILSRDNINSDSLLDELENLRKQNLGRFCKDIFRVIMNINLETNKAQIHWQNVLEHRLKLTNHLGRNVDFRVAMLDYFSNTKTMVHSPKVLEMTDFAEIIRHTVVDELTGLYNRHFLTRTVEREIVRAKRNGRSLSIVVGDIDHFKSVNDTFGHPAADQVLVQVAEILQNLSRPEDAACQFGGEEFLLIVPEIDAHQAFHITEQIRKNIAEHNFPVERKITMSFGVASYPDCGDNFKEILIAADQALYAAKTSGRNRTLVFQANQIRN